MADRAADTAPGWQAGTVSRIRTRTRTRTVAAILLLGAGAGALGPEPLPPRRRPRAIGGPGAGGSGGTGRPRPPPPPAGAAGMASSPVAEDCPFPPSRGRAGKRGGHGHGLGRGPQPKPRHDRRNGRGGSSAAVPVPDHPLIRDLEERGRKVRYLLRGGGRGGEGVKLRELRLALEVVEGIAEQMAEVCAGGAADADVRMAASALLDGSVRDLADRAFSSAQFAGRRRGGGVSRAAQAAADRATLGMRALRLQLELGEGEPPLLSAPYGAVARVTWIGALRSLTAMRGGGGERRLLRNSFGKPTTPADVAFAVLQKLVTGVGVRPSVAVAPPGASPANAAANAASYRLDERDFSMVLNAFVTDGRMDMAHRVMALQERTERAPPLSAVAYSIMIRGYGHKSDAANVDMMYKKAQTNGVVPDTIMCNSLIDAYVNCDRVDRAHATFTALTERTGGDRSGLPNPDVRSYNTMLKGYANRGDLKSALGLSRTMDEAGLWNGVTTNTLVKAAVNAEKFDAADEILGRFTVAAEEARGGGRDRSRHQRHHPNLEAYTALIDGYGKAGMLHKALGTLKVMQARDVEPNEYSYTCLVGAMARCGKIEQANKLLAVMESDGVMPTTVTYNAFMAGILEGAPPPDESPSEEWTASGSVEFESEEQKLYNERVVDSLRLFTKMVKAKVSPNAITVSTIVESLGRCNPPRISEARSIVERLDEDGEVSRRHIRVGTSLVQACGYAMDFPGVVEAFESIAKPDVVALNAYLASCCRCGKVKEALEILQALTKSASKVDSKGPTPDVISYTVLIAALLKMESSAGSHQAYRLYGEMKSVWKIRPDIALVDLVLTAMVSGGSVGLTRTDVNFTRMVMRDADGLSWRPGQYEDRIKAVRGVLIGRTSEKWKEDEDYYGMGSEPEDPLFAKKGWNRVDSGFRLWGGGLNHQQGGSGRAAHHHVDEEESKGVDEFLESRGWNDFDSGFRLF